MAGYFDSLLDRAHYIWKLIIYTRVYVAVGSALMIYALSYLPDFGFTISLGAAVFGAVFAVYAMNRKSDMEEDEANLEFGGSELAERTYKIGLVSLAIAFLAGFISGMYALITVAIFISLISAYSFRIFPSSFPYHRLKEIPFIKNLVVAVALSFIWVSGSIIEGVSSLNPIVFGIFLFFLCKVLIGAIIPDIRDMKGDRKAGVETIPVRYGVFWTKGFLLAVNLAATLIYFGMLWTSILPPEALLAGTVNFFTFPLIHKTDQENAGTMTLITESNLQFTFSILLLIGGAL